MNVSPGNGLLASLIAAFLLLAGLSGIGTAVFTSPINDHDRSGFSSPSVTDPRVLHYSSAPAQASFSTNANETPRWRSDIMDSYESVPSLAALAKQGNTQARLAPDAADRHAVLPSGTSR